MADFSVFFAFILFASAWLTAFVLRRFSGVQGVENRYAAIDGLRGVLALGVFIHHGAVWYNYLHTGYWKDPASNFYNQLGQGSVSVFFMISSFLFVQKLLDHTGPTFDWMSFFRKRFFRLAPLHFVLVAVLIVIVFAESNWQVHTSWYDLFSSGAKWFGFGVIGFAEINGMDASVINSGVLWSLSYEWLLYFSLPILALFLTRAKPSIPFLLLGASFIAVTLLYRSYALPHLLSFVGGAIAPIILKYGKGLPDFKHPGFGIVLLLALVGNCFFHSPDELISKLLLIFSFTLIALGNDFFGLLSSATLRFLGEISYSVYLSHGILLYLLFHVCIGSEVAQGLSIVHYVLNLGLASVLIVLLSWLLYRTIERPWMRKK